MLIFRYALDGPDMKARVQLERKEDLEKRRKEQERKRIAQDRIEEMKGEMCKDLVHKHKEELRRLQVQKAHTGNHGGMLGRRYN